MREDRIKIRLRLRRAETGTVAAFLILVMVFYALSGGLFLSAANIRAIVRVAAQLGIIVVGQAFLMIAGEFDLSVGAVYGLAGIVFIAMQQFVNPTLAFVTVMVVALAIGLLNGFFVFKLKIPSMIATLGSLFIYRGLVYFISGGFGTHIPEEYKRSILVRLLGGEPIDGLNNIFFVFVVLAAVFTVVITRTRFGNRTYAVGDAPLSAFSRGVSPTRVKWASFVICSMLAALSGVATICNSFTAYPTMGSELELQSIASCVVGGVALSGGIGTIWGAAVGAFFLSTIKSGLILIGAPPYWYITFVGVVLILAVAINRVLAERRRY